MGLPRVHPAAELFPMMVPEQLAELAADIKRHGLIHPVVLCDGAVLDGRNRWLACELAGVKPVTVDWTGESPTAFVLAQNLHRRHLTEAQRAACATKVEPMFAAEAKVRQGTRTDIVPNSAQCENRRARDDAASAVGVRPQAVSDAKRIMHDAPEVFAEMEQGRLNLSQASAAAAAPEVVRQQIVEQVKSGGKAPPAKAIVEVAKVATSSKFNETNDKIEWARFSWNPVTGCKHGCTYCYARDIAARFGSFEPKFWPDRLAAPANTKPKPDIPGGNMVFVCSMADLFGEWVPDDWIMPVIEAVEKHEEWQFLFLTKNPRRLRSVVWPRNAWVGASAVDQAMLDRACQGLADVKARVRFLSCEPLRGSLTLPNNPPIDWIIIGGQSASSGEPARQPEWPWVERLLIDARRWGVKVYFKPNLLVRPREMPR